jgi:uncharacterized membrane protein YhaH (DUF805 family)
MNYYLNGIINFSDFSSRSTRKEYWSFQLINIMIILILRMASSYLGILYALFIFFPSISISVRRLHDIGKSGWWYFILFIPIVGLIVFLCFMLLNSDSDNIYGHRKN